MIEATSDSVGALSRILERTKRGAVVLIIFGLSVLTGWMLAALPLTLCDEIFGTRLMAMTGKGIMPGIVVAAYLIGDGWALRAIGGVASRRT